LVERLARLYGWSVQPEDLVFIPGVVTGLNMACHAFGKPGDGALVQTPVYGPFLTAPGNAGLERQVMALTYGPDGRYALDPDRMREAITPATRLFLLCNPHNPVGRVFERAELLAMAECCLAHDVIIVSDEIHCDFVYDGRHHVPIASLDPEAEPPADTAATIDDLDVDPRSERGIELALARQERHEAAEFCRGEE